MPVKSELKTYVEENIQRIYETVYAADDIDENERAILNGQLEILKDICNICNKRGRF